jgi:hypothetical protein
MPRLAALALALALGATRLASVPLRWRPTDGAAAAVNAAARTFQGKKVRVVPFADARQDPQLIGRNVEDDQPRTVTTREDVGAWCADQLAELLRRAGVEVVPEGADLTVSGQVVAFFVEEDDRYRGAVALKLSVTDLEGKERWAGRILGDSDRFGRSYKYENYMETLSDALLHAAEGFFGAPELGRSIR